MTFQVVIMMMMMMICLLVNISVARRSSQQIYNVTIFFLFFMSLYGILGVQFFGAMKYHCVKNGTNIKWVPFLHNDCIHLC